MDDYLVTGGIPDGDHVKKLKDAEGVHELRVALDRTTWRLTFWKPSNKVIVILTVFRKTQDGTQAADIDRAIIAKTRCKAEVVAERSGMSQPALSRIEGGGGIPDIATLLRLGAAMGVRFRVELVIDDDTTEIEPLTVHHRQLANT